MAIPHVCDEIYTPVTSTAWVQICYHPHADLKINHLQLKQTVVCVVIYLSIYLSIPHTKQV